MRMKVFTGVFALLLLCSTAFGLTADDYLRLSLQKLKEARLYAEKSLKAGKVKGFNYQLYMGYLNRTIENLEKALDREERTYGKYYRLKLDSDLLIEDLEGKK